MVENKGELLRIIVDRQQSTVTAHSLKIQLLVSFVTGSKATKYIDQIGRPFIPILPFGKTFWPVAAATSRPAGKGKALVLRR